MKQPINPKVSKLIEISKDWNFEQRSHEWFEARKTRITASDAASCLPKTFELCNPYIKEFKLDEKTFEKSNSKYCNPYSNEQEFILKKVGLGKVFEGNEFTRHGQKYEDIILRFYERRKKKECLTFGLLPHQTISFLGASPDAITKDGICVEIKSPYRRILNGIVPFYYYIQCMIQLEVFNLETCHYIEATINEIDREIFKNNDNDTIFIKKYGEIENKNINYAKGLLINMDNGKKFIYPPTKYESDKKLLLKWAQKKCIKYKEFNTKIDYYKIEKYSIIKIKRNKQWFEIAKSMLNSTWNKVLSFDKEKYINEHYTNVLKLSDDDDLSQSQDDNLKKNNYFDTCIL